MAATESRPTSPAESRAESRTESHAGSCAHPTRRSGRLTPLAIVIAALAILLGTTGGAVAAIVITGANIKDGTVTGADIKNGSLAGVDVRDNSLTATDLLDESRAWGGHRTAAIDDFLSPTYTPVVTKSLTTTRAGFLTITGTFYAEDDFSLEPLGRLFYTVQVDGKTVGGHRALTYSGQADGENGAITVVVPAAKGSHTVSLVAQEAGGGSFIFSGSLSVVYSPVGSTTGLVIAKPIAPRTANR